MVVIILQCSNSTLAVRINITHTLSSDSMYLWIFEGIGGSFFPVFELILGCFQTVLPEARINKPLEFLDSVCCSRNENNL